MVGVHGEADLARVTGPAAGNEGDSPMLVGFKQQRGRGASHLSPQPSTPGSQGQRKLSIPK